MHYLPRVLLVEDTSSLALTYQQYLRNEPVELIHVENGTDAKQVIAAKPPELVLLDLKLPDMDGQEILQWIRVKGFPLPSW